MAVSFSMAEGEEETRPSTSTASATFEVPAFKLQQASAVVPVLPFTRDSVCSLLQVFPEEVLCELLTIVHETLFPRDSASNLTNLDQPLACVKEALADIRRSLIFQWKRTCPKVIVSLTFLCCNLLYVPPDHHHKPNVHYFGSTKASCGSILKPATMSHLFGYSLMHGWASCLLDSDKLSSEDAHEILDRLVASVVQSPLLRQVHAPLWALCYHGELFMSRNRLDKAIGYFRVVRAIMQEQTYADRQEKVSMDILYERVCWLLLTCMDQAELQGTRGGLFAASDVTLVVDILAIHIRNGELKHAHGEFFLVCSRGSRDKGHFDHTRAHEIVDYFQRTPRLRNTKMHFLILCCYADHLKDEGEDDKATALLNYVIKEVSTKPALQDVKMLALVRLHDPHSEELLPLFDSLPIKHEIQRAGFYLTSKKPQEAFESAMKVLLAASRGDPTIVSLDVIFLVLASASAMVNDYSGALILIEQARYACQDTGASLACIDNEWATYLYVSGQLEQARALNEKALQLASKQGHTSIGYRSALHLKAKLYYAFHRQNLLFLQMDFELPQSVALDIAYKTTLHHEIASSSPFKGLIETRLVPDPLTHDNGERVPDIEAAEQRYSSLKQQSNLKFVDLFREGVLLCLVYMIEGHGQFPRRAGESASAEGNDALVREQNEQREIFYNKGRALIKELSDHLMKHACNFQYMQYHTMEMAVDLAALGVAYMLHTPTIDLLTAVLKHVSSMLFSLANSSDITPVVESSNFYKIVYLLILKVCCFTFDDSAAFVWSQRCKAMALSAHLFSVYKNCPALQDYEHFMCCDMDCLNSIARCFPGRRTIVIDYTIVPPDLLLITLIALTPEGEYAERYSQWVSMRFLDGESQNTALQELNLLSSKFFKNHALASQENQDHFSERFLPPRLVAENDKRGGISSKLCLGLVAKTQRLAAEIELALQRGDRRGAQHLASEMQNDFAKLYDLLIKPVEDKLYRLLESHLYDVLLIAPDEDLWLVPFSALYNRDSEKYLIEEIPIVMAPSVRVAGFCKDVYEQMSGSEEVPPELIVGRTAGYPKGWPELSCAEKEMRAVHGSLSKRGLYLHLDPDDKDAKSTILWLMKHTSWIHFTVHGEITEKFPRGSLVLGSSDEERLDGEDIVACRPLSARAVVLSACETGLGAIRGEGILGLVRAFMQAGVPLVIASLYKVADQYTAKYMEHLYRKLKEDNLCVPFAMQQVVVELMEQSFAFKETEVLKWSAFTCVGYPYVTLPVVDSS